MFHWRGQQQQVDGKNQYFSEGHVCHLGKKRGEDEVVDVGVSETRLFYHIGDDSLRVSREQEELVASGFEIFLWEQG